MRSRLKLRVDGSFHRNVVGLLQCGANHRVEKRSRISRVRYLYQSFVQGEGISIPGSIKTARLRNENNREPFSLRRASHLEKMMELHQSRFCVKSIEIPILVLDIAKAFYAAEVCLLAPGIHIRRA